MRRVTIAGVEFRLSKSNRLYLTNPISRQFYAFENVDGRPVVHTTASPHGYVLDFHTLEDRTRVLEMTGYTATTIEEATKELERQEAELGREWWDKLEGAL